MTTTLSTRERERRNLRIGAAAGTIVFLGISAWLHSANNVGLAVSFWPPTIAGFTWGVVLWTLARRTGKTWLSHVTMAGLVVVFLFLLTSKTWSPFAWTLAVFAGAAFSSSAFLTRIPEQTVQKTPRADIRPWKGAGVTATLTELPVGRKSRTRPGVRIDSATLQTVFPVIDVAQLFDQETSIAETANGQPLAFLTHVGVAAKSSVIADATGRLPAGALIIHAAADESRPAVVFDGADAASFETWVRTLPEG
ncbi:hypothetical protein KK092_07275 [Curtobacterium flaccumfaciens pv. flaccumfaciens]|uniref:hypothetical protein n=1 Tax=Curtobacterium flaccumfaciens TaxID=2035 RepID=UPI001BDF678D|nr:hypothetical protein [Curtobacterium flaccumfaciens]MBT1669178.1 hypothetical protein [Curtobacterium flaccumfaciens pv. flaccumfaciens]